jgi:hypothetical protein
VYGFETFGIDAFVEPVPNGLVAWFPFEAQQLDGFLVELPPKLGQKPASPQLVKRKEPDHRFRRMSASPRLTVELFQNSKDRRQIQKT